MAIGPVELNGAMTRLQDITSQKHNENVKGAVDQTNFQAEFKKEIDTRLNQVHKGDDPKNGNTRYDAKEKGNGSYEGDGGRKRKKEQTPKDGKVLVKGHGGFDIKI